jgi:hypothetical protein
MHTTEHPGTLEQTTHRYVVKYTTMNGSIYFWAHRTDSPNTQVQKRGRFPPCHQGGDSGFCNGPGRAFVATGTTFGTLCGVYDKGGSGYDSPLNRTDIDTAAASITTLPDLQHHGSLYIQQNPSPAILGPWIARSSVSNTVARHDRLQREYKYIIKSIRYISLILLYISYLFDFINVLSNPDKQGLIDGRMADQAPRITWLALKSTLTASPNTSASSLTASLVITA